MILITSAMDEESTEINKIIENKEEVILDEYSGGKKIYKGEIAGHKVISLTTGIGKVNAAMWNSYIISRYKITHIINSGTAGGIKESTNLKITDIIVSSETAFHDFNLTKFGHKIGQVPGFPQKFKADENLLSKIINITQDKFKNINVHIGLILTGDQFIGDEKQLEEIKNNFADALAVEMESAAVAQVAYTFKIPFIIIRSISDLLNIKDNHIDFNKFLQDASMNSAKMVRELIKLI
ncbi:5'-methylthioadenosine/adenosylhomocysteine nucleosidase [Borrelia hermsii]|uniref:adenosylhomocysteine nucleosidase n=3 Tax=Borrelia hermsii TaxID=140 RepID=A0AAN0X5Z4_BORHE|nr:5'-methylthioadenosine/adenosylhomocysteine nucleosidase [Borrelia hermsii]AAX16885.1 5'-methylthioadenosine nucleosidase [Borrelia hermsii DAH]AMR75464.1 5'-methylthioadenosine nucleosidase/ S-adenosylhomocysteine nucleosidase [Borrelia hermsii]ANA43184.1 5'-nucleosidase [Borrelia hermsii HS1]UEQ07018.1 5'-methylthioadenosine/adenosylhomocysteine nucleosidase [Borrelia hermsii]UPA07699.1 5'-methylthioadenosine/adenosylhomocysteine nucleosidase [Borrelia hermsii DAH]